MPVPVSAARRYAEAAFQLAENDGKVDQAQRDLRIAAQLAGDEQLTRAVDSPAVPVKERRHVVEQVLGPRVSAEILMLAILLASRERFALLPDVSRHFDELVRKARGITAVTVTSAAPLTDDEVVAVRGRAEQLAGGAVEMTVAVDPNLIGGITVRIGDRLIDASVRGRLERLRERLIQGAA